MSQERHNDGLDAAPEAAPRAPVSILPPFRVLTDFLDDASVEDLLQLAVSREADFAPTRVGMLETAMINPEIRTSLMLRSRAELAKVFDARLRALAPAMVTDMRLTAFEVSGVELELVAHGDGAFYKRHIDTRTGGDTKSQRVLSGVYYFNHQPKAFSGGALRLYALGDDAQYVDIEPLHNSLLVFPSWAPHEVMPVSRPSLAFIDSRFAVNCWMHRKTPLATPAPPGQSAT